MTTRASSAQRFPSGALKLVLLGAISLVALGAALASGVGGGDSAACELEEHPEQDGGHLPALPPGFVYGAFPPTSGPSADRPLVWNEYREPVSQFRLVHNLLHGGLGVQYGRDVPRGAVDDLRAWYRSDPDGVLVAPLPRLGDQIVLTAWRNAARCRDFRERTFTAFRSRHRFNGPERPPRESMRPGRGGLPNAFGLRVSPVLVRDRVTVSFVSPRSTSVEVEIRSGTSSGPLLHRLGGVSLSPNVRVRLVWDLRDRFERRIPAGTHFAVVRSAAPSGEPAGAARFRVR